MNGKTFFQLRKNYLYFQKYFSQNFITPKSKNELTKIYKKLYFHNNTFVHRDFHASNIMINKNKLGLIDSQDAVIGNPAYDLASLIDDVRYKSSNLLKKNIYSYFLQKSKKIDRKSFENDFLILSVLRNLKILGIFTRLAKRDKKNNYLKLIPYTWKLIKLRTSGNNIFDELVSCLNKEK